MRKGVRTELSDEPAPTQRGAVNRPVGLLERAHIRLHLGVGEHNQGVLGATCRSRADIAQQTYL